MMSSLIDRDLKVQQVRCTEIHFFLNQPSHVYMILVMGWRKLAEIRI